MSLKSLYRNYFQKSRVFLYPILGIPRNESVTPILTYMSWEEYYTTKDCKLICMFHLREDRDFVEFEKRRLVGNKYFHDFKETVDGKGLYVFDLSEMVSNWNCVLSGSYSKLTTEHKDKVKSYYSNNDSNYIYVESYLYPEKYFAIYSELLAVPVNELKKVGELCSKPAFPEENLIADIKQITLNKSHD